MATSLGLLAEGTANAIHQFARVQSMTEWWQWLLLLAVTAGVLTYVIALYIRDCVELSSGLSLSLMALRVLAFGGILFFFLDLEKRTEEQRVNDSRAVILVDTSQSMGLHDADSTSVPAGPSRMELVVAELAQASGLIGQLRANHAVMVYRFDQGTKPVEVASFPKLALTTAADAGGDEAAALREARWLAAVAGVVLLVSILGGVVYLFTSGRPRGSDQTSWSLLVSIVALIAALVILAVANLRNPDVGLLATVGLQKSSAPTESEIPQESQPAESVPEVDWSQQLLPRGVETRLGDALRYLVNSERGGPISGIIVLSDGGNNAGIDYTAAIAAAHDADIPVFPVGLGSDRRPANVRVVDLEAPSRVYPADSFSMTGYLQASGLQGRQVTVDLLSGPADGPPAEQSSLVSEEQRRVTLPADGELLPLKFETSPSEDKGRRQYVLRVTAPEQDSDQRDNEKTAVVEVIERRNRVLLVAGGPTREYRFLRNLLFRDRDTIMDVYLQTATAESSQESNEMLFEFPRDPDELFQYDCIVAFDPDWQALDESQVELLERWVAEKAGGLIVVAGPVFTREWTRMPRGRSKAIDIIKALYPVVFYNQGAATLSMGRFGGESPWPLQFTPEGLEAEFLWLEEDALAAEQAWSSFPGVYGYYAVKDPKPGAQVYARFSDPDTAIDGELPIYMASHFYGAGRVFFQASGELWRIRAEDDGYFEQYYTKLIRWVSQGRLLRDSSRGVLLVDKERCLLGDQIQVRATLTDAQHLPLTDEEVSAVLIQPDTTRVALTLRRLQESQREGMYAGQFMALQEGDYRVELSPPQAAADELLAREVRVRIPALEIERPERNDPLMKEIADKTGGAYFVGIDAAMNRRGGGTAVADLLQPQDQVSYLPGTPDRKFDQRLMTWLMSLICGVLCLEWLIRRLSRLA